MAHFARFQQLLSDVYGVKRQIYRRKSLRLYHILCICCLLSDVRRSKCGYYQLNDNQRRQKAEIHSKKHSQILFDVLSVVLAKFV